MNDNILIGARIRNARKNKRMSMKTLGIKVGLHESTVSRYEKGDIQALDIEKMKEFAEALDVTVSYLIGWNDDIKEEIEKDPVGIANEFADMLMDQEFRDAFKIYTELSEEKKKQARDFVKFLAKN